MIGGYLGAMLIQYLIDRESQERYLRWVESLPVTMGDGRKS